MELSVIETLAPGTMIGEYQVTGILGKGGFGIVYAAVQPEIGKRVAIKVLHEDAAKVEEISVRFKNEARAVNEINHPNIIDIFSFGTLPGTGVPYFIMEQLEGVSLDAKVGSGKRMSPAQLVELMAPVASAVDAAHAKGIVHRDLKPANIFIDDSSGVVKVLDFGVAKFQTMTTQLTGRGETLGTWLYMAPEQCAGDEVDARADVYAFGVIMFHALTGRFPIEGKHPMELLTRHLQHNRTRPSEFGTPEALDDALMKCLESDPADRYGSLGEAHAALAAAVRDLGEAATLSLKATGKFSRAEVASATALANTQLSQPPAPLPERTELDATSETLSSDAAPAATAPAPGGRAVYYIGGGVIAVVGLVAGVFMLGRGGQQPRPRVAKPAVMPTSEKATDAHVPAQHARPASASDARAPARSDRDIADAGSPIGATPDARPKLRARPSPHTRLPRTIDMNSQAFQLRYTRLSAAIANCRRRAPDSQGKLKMWITVAPSGRVSEVRVVRAPDATISSCAAAATRRAHFPASQKGLKFAPTISF